MDLNRTEPVVPNTQQLPPQEENSKPVIGSVETA